MRRLRLLADAAFLSGLASVKSEFMSEHIFSFVKIRIFAKIFIHEVIINYSIPSPRKRLVLVNASLKI